MSKYTEALEFFVENGIALNKEQVEALKEEFLGEATNDQNEDDNDHFEDDFGKPYDHEQFKNELKLTMELYDWKKEMDSILEQYITEDKSKEFRYVVGKDNGHLYKVVYDLDKKNITHDNITPADDKFRDEVVSKGHNNYQSKGNKVVAIVDASTNKRVDKVDAFPVIHNSGGDIKPCTIDSTIRLYKRFVKSPEELEDIRKDLEKKYPTGICPNPGYKSAIKRSEEKGQNAISYKVGDVDNTQTYKTTNPKAVTKGMLYLDK